MISIISGNYCRSSGYSPFQNFDDKAYLFLFDILEYFGRLEEKKNTNAGNPTTR